ncbi:hypothetical protein Btru_052805 [Bulinus truncatus]|nr:hypothetical protein Btru_052805 [Bulinus truncatus]
MALAEIVAFRLVTQVETSMKTQTKRAVRSPSAVFGSNAADSQANEDGIVLSLDAKNQYSENGSPRFSGSGEIFDKQPVVGQEGEIYSNQAFSQYPAESPQRPAVGKRFNEFVGKRSGPAKGIVGGELIRNMDHMYKHSPSGEEHAMSEKEMNQLRLLNLVRRILQSDDTTKRQYEFVGKRPYDFLGKRSYDFLGKRTYDFLGKRYYDFLGKRDGAVGEEEDGASRELSATDGSGEQDGGKRYSEFLGKRKRAEEQGSALMSDSARLAALLQNNSLRKRISEMLIRQRLAEQVPEFIGK